MATKSAWKKKIIAACEEAGTYRPQFECVIETLASILEIRDEAMKQYKADGNKPVVTHTNKGGYTNQKKHPALQVIQEQDKCALGYWKELGLTAKGYKAINGHNPVKKETTFEDVLSGIGL